MSNYVLRLPDSLKEAAKRWAAADDTTMNQLLIVAIAEKISALETASFFEKRALLGDRAKADAAWRKVGTSAAIEGDKWDKE